MTNLQLRARTLSAQVASLGVRPAKKPAKKPSHVSYNYKSLGGQPAPWAQRTAVIRDKPTVKPRVSKFAPQYFVAKNGQTPVKGIDYATPLEMREMHNAVFEQLKQSAGDYLIPQIIETLRKEGLSVSDLKDADAFLMRARDGLVTRYKIEEMMHGGGSSSGSSFTVMTPSGLVNGVNNVFIWSSAPSVIVLDNGNAMNKISADGTVNWTGTIVTTLNQAPNFNVFGY